MQKFKIKTTQGDYEIEGDRYSMVKYLTVYKNDEVVFEINASKVLELQ